MSLRWKVLILLSVVSASFAATTYVVQRWIVVPGFLQAERAQAETDLARCIEAIRRDGHHLASLARDWGSWDDTCRYIDDLNESFSSENLIPETFVTNQIAFLALLRPDGQLVWGEARDYRTKELLSMPEFFRAISRPDHPLVAHPTPESPVSGMVMTELGPMLIASQPILTSENQGPVRGAMIMGRLLDEQAVSELASRTLVALKLWSIPEGAMPAHDRDALGKLAAANSIWIRDDDANTLEGYTVIRDLYGEPAMLLRAGLPRSISRRGFASAQLATGTSIAGGFTLLLVMWVLLRRAVINPLLRLTSHAVRVGTEGDLRVRLNMQRKDEIGVLAREFDRMVVNLAEFRARLTETARQAGMADVAVEVLHNVGNVLNSVNVSAGVVTEKLRNSEVSGLGQAAQLMMEHQDDLGRFITSDERGRQLPGYLTELAGFLADEQNTMIEEMKALSESIEHIKQIVAAQQERSSTAQMIELVDPAALVDEALRLNTDSFKKHHITVVREYERVGEIPLDRHKVLQILVNLLKNAKNALRECDRPDRGIALKIEKVCGQEADRVRISVTDNGIGIQPENLSRMFTFGFSTRKDGHGIGLHSAANLAREMAGTLSAASDGPSLGAEFILEVPFVHEQVQA